VDKLVATAQVKQRLALRHPCFFRGVGGCRPHPLLGDSPGRAADPLGDLGIHRFMFASDFLTNDVRPINLHNAVAKKEIPIFLHCDCGSDRDESSQGRGLPMSFYKYIWSLLRHSFHRTLLAFEAAEALLAAAAHGLSYMYPSLGEILGPISLTLLGLIPVTLLVGMFLAAYSIYREMDQERVQLLNHPVKAERDRLKAEIEEFYASNRQVFQQGGFATAQYETLERDHTFFVEKNGALRAEQAVRFRATGRVNMVDIEVGADSVVEWVSDMQFRAKVDAGHEIVVLHGGGSPTLKSFYLVFLPEVPRNTVITYTCSWQWPRAWERLIEGKADGWQQEIRSPNPVPVCTFRFKLARGLPAVKLRNIGGGGGQSVVSPVDVSGYSEFIWKMENVPDGTLVDVRLEP